MEMPNFIDQELEDLEEMTNIADIQDKIDKARNWALDHFNAKEAGNPSLIDPGTLEFTKPSSFIEFPEPDEMIVIPSILGKKGFVHYYFQLRFNEDGTTEWRTNHPIFGTPMPPLKVT